MSTKNNPTVGHPPGTVNEALSWLNRNACGEPGLHLVSLRESVRAVSREIDAIKKARDDHFALRLLAETERDRLLLAALLAALLVAGYNTPQDGGDDDDVIGGGD